MSDIVERLRDDQPGERQCVREARMDLGGLLVEAADEIEKLRAALLLARIAVSHACEDSGRLLYTQELRRIDAALGEKE